MYKQNFDVEKYPKTFAYVLENDTVARRCNKCGSVILKQPLEVVLKGNPFEPTDSDPNEYPYQCMFCDENLYEFETHSGECHTSKELDDLCCQTRDILELDNNIK